jgi:ribosome maturation factor RimP
MEKSSTKKNTTLPAALQTRVQEICEQHNAYVIDIVLRGTESRRVVEIYTDSPDGMTLEMCSTLSEELGAMFDAANAFAGAYRLEVSSPGVERSLMYIWQYQRNAGRRAALALNDDTVLEGRIGEVSEDSFILLLTGKSIKKGLNAKPNAAALEAVEVSLNQVRSAIVQVEMK